MKKFISVISFIIVLIVLSLVSSAIAELAPKAGDGVYRDIIILNCTSRLSPIGHAGLYIGGGQVIHMQGSGCRKDNFMDTFYNRFWGAIYQGKPAAAKKRIDTANWILGKHPKYSFFNYKGPDGYRCDGMVEKIFEEAGGNIVDDRFAFSLNPRKQWKSWNNSYNAITSLGTSRLGKWEMSWSDYYLWSALTLF